MANYIKVIQQKNQFNESSKGDRLLMITSTQSDSSQDNADALEALSGAISNVYENDLEAAAGGVQFGSLYYLPDGTTRKRVIPDEVVTYASTNHISPAAALKLGKLLNEYREAGVEPEFLWVGGTEYNNTAQTGAIIGGDGEVVGTGDSFTLGTNHVQFNGGKILRFANPSSVKGTNVVNYLLTGVYTSPTATKPFLGNYLSTARGVKLEHLANGGGISGTISNISNGGTGAKTVSNGAYKQNSTDWQVFALTNSTTALGTYSSEMRGIGYGAMTDSGFWNDVNYFHIGSYHDTAASTDGKISVVMISSSTLVNWYQGVQSSRVMQAPFLAGVVSQEEPLVVFQGDSHIDVSFGFEQFVMGHGDGAGFACGGQWTGSSIGWNSGWGGENATQIKGRYDNFLRRGILSHVGDELYYFLQIESEDNDDGSIALAMADQVYADTGATMIISSYPNYGGISGSLTAATIAHANARGWHYVPFAENKHQSISAGGYVTYGYFTDGASTHSTTAGRRIKAQIFAASVPYLNDAGPRWDINDIPVITGTVAVGQTLTVGVDSGTCRNSPDSRSYQWMANLTDIAGATSNTYELTANEQGKYIACRVTAVKAGFNSAEITTDPTVIVA